MRTEGASIRRRIYRDFPTRYHDHRGNRVVVGFDVVEVRRNGEPAPWFTQDIANGVRINSGDDRLLTVAAVAEVAEVAEAPPAIGAQAGLTQAVRSGDRPPWQSGGGRRQ
ncbi:MAG: hypothetical protein M3414_05010 [Pseudomonadota bacterium]|nr:hypothetical protein [Pseudomonadota bacterium]